jgi:FkbM family methyltransferase
MLRDQINRGVEASTALALDSTRLLWAGKGPKKVSRWTNLCRLYFRPSQHILDFDVQYLNVHSLRYLYREIFVREEYLFPCEIQTPVIFDCGANIGMATLFFKWLFPRSRITAFEPDPTTFQFLCRNINENHLSDVFSHNVALWNDDGSVPFFVPENSRDSLMMSTNPSRNGGRQIMVPSRKLSDYIDGPIDLLKLDVEGAEHKVICDLISSGKMKQVRRMFVEYHHNISADGGRLGAFLTMLEGCGFRYQINSWISPIAQRDRFQDVLLYAYR